MIYSHKLYCYIVHLNFKVYIVIYKRVFNHGGGVSFLKICKGRRMKKKSGTTAIDHYYTAFALRVFIVDLCRIHAHILGKFDVDGGMKLSNFA